MTEPLSVLFVCTANICRSPVHGAHRRATSPADADVVFSSAGTHGSTGHPMNPVMAATLPPELDVAGFRSRRLEPRDR